MKPNQHRDIFGPCKTHGLSQMSSTCVEKGICSTGSVRSFVPVMSYGQKERRYSIFEQYSRDLEDPGQDR